MDVLEKWVHIFAKHYCGEGIWCQMIPCQRYKNSINMRHVNKK